MNEYNTYLFTRIIEYSKKDVEVTRHTLSGTYTVMGFKIKILISIKGT